jgi:hypothetical protein
MFCELILQKNNLNIISTFIPTSSKRCHKNEAPHINKDSTPLCVDVVFHRNFSSAGGTDQQILPATLRHVGPSHRLPDMMAFLALALQMGHTLKDALHDHNKHQPAKSSTQLCCHLCSSRGQTKGTAHKCARCDVGLCVGPCFEEYHTKVNW